MEIFDYEDLINALIKERRSSPTKSNYTSAQWLELYPELNTDFQRLLQEAEKEHRDLVNSIKKLIRTFMRLGEPNYQIGKELTRLTLGLRLEEVSSRIKWLKQGLVKELASKRSVSASQVEKARNYPIINLLSERPKKGLIKCPWHKEKTLSCKVYPTHLHCVFCGKSQDSIGFLMEQKHMSFPDAVKFLMEDQK